MLSNPDWEYDPELRVLRNDKTYGLIERKWPSGYYVVSYLDESEYPTAISRQIFSDADDAIKFYERHTKC